MGLALEVAGLIVLGDDGRAILKVDELKVPAGACLGIRGPSGAGKSTFLFAVAGLLDLAEGRVAWGDNDIARLGEEERARFRRKSIGMVFQDYLLFEELSAAGNAALASAYSAAARRSAITQRGVQMLAHLGIPPSARSVASFSGGERQRVAVARALATDPAIILADEPTASLDRAAADSLVDDLTRLARESGKTLIAVSHDAAVHARMDRLVDIVDGRLTSDQAAHA